MTLVWEKKESEVEEAGTGKKEVTYCPDEVEEEKRKRKLKSMLTPQIDVQFPPDTAREWHGEFRTAGKAAAV